MVGTAPQSGREAARENARIDNKRRSPGRSG